MKDKKTLYVLIPLVLMIWGYVAFRFLSYGVDDQDIEPIRVSEIIAEDREINQKPTLELSYRDPFLKNYKRANKNRSVANPKTTKTKVTTVKWDKIVYNGFMKNAKTSKKIALMNIEGKVVLGEKSFEFKGIEIVKILEDSVLLKKETSTKWFLKTKN